MGSVFHMLCPGHGDSKQVTAATAFKAMQSLTFLTISNEYVEIKPRAYIMSAILYLLPGHPHGQNFAPVFFEIAGKVKSCILMFSIENQQNQLVTSGFIENRA